MSPPFTGLWCPITTPFGDGGAADPARLAAQIDVYARWPLAGVVLFGTSGEGPMIEPEEEAPLLRAARSALGARGLIAQVGHESVRATVTSARRAADAGADAILCLPPRYYPIDRDGLAGFYRAVAEGCGLPLLAYHIPQRSHVELSADLLCELAAEGTLVGIKESAGDLALQRALRERAGPSFSILNGSARLTLEALREGGQGAVLAVADAAPEAALAIFEAHAAGAAERAEAAQRALDPLARCFGPRFGVPGIKAAIDLRDWPGGGPPRPPLIPLDAHGREEVAAALRAAGVDLS